MNDDYEEVTRELGEAADLQMDEFLRSAMSMMFENDNGSSTVTAVITTADGTDCTLEFELSILSIDGVPTRERKEDEQDG